MRAFRRLYVIALAVSMSLLTTAAAADCSAFPQDLIEKWGKEKQLVLNLSMAKGRNLKTMRETIGAPDPATFRTLADGFETSEFEGVERLGIFLAPEEIVEGLRQTADLLEAALATGGSPTDPAWQALSDFYTPQFFGKHNSAISYYLSEAGCA